MGLLRNAMKLKSRINRKSPLEIKRQIVLEEIYAMNVRETDEGVPVEQLSYERLKEEWVRASFRWIDAEADSEKWF